jgi:2-amino-4-hydroxy-6-hydroxymethyldihydropteridine diphosphokinase
MIREQRLRVEYVAVLSLGSNLGDREATIRAAVRDIAAVSGVVALKASALVETPALRPEGVDASAPAYLNAVLMVRSALDPHDLLAALNRIESAHGRVRGERWGDRTLDIDIVSCGAMRVDTAELTIPHARAAERAFVLAPWLEIDPDATLPGHGRVHDLMLATGQRVTPYPAEPLL